MKLTVDGGALADTVTWAARSLPARTSVPVLHGLLLTADAGTLEVSAYDYDTSARAVTAADVVTPGQVVVSGRLLTDIVKALPDRPVEVTLDGSKVTIRCGGSRFTLLTMPLDDYPTLPVMPSASGTVQADRFAHAVAQVAVAASREDSPPILAGVLVEIVDDVVTLMATDRYRLAVRTLPWQPSTPGVTATALIRARTLADVAKAFPVGGDVTVALAATGDAGLVGFEAAGRRSTSLLMDGDYPRVRALFPAESSTMAVVDVEALVAAVRRVSLVVERHTAVRLSFEDGVVTVYGGQGEDAQASETVDATLEGEGLSIGFSPAYLLDGLAALDNPSVRFALTASGKPAVLTGQAGGVVDDSYRYLIMPMRLP